MKNAIIFCNRKVEVSELFRSLVKYDFDAGALHGDMDQRARMQMLANFRDGKLKLLVASDVAARGLDIPDVSHVFNLTCRSMRKTMSTASDAPAGPDARASPSPSSPGR